MYKWKCVDNRSEDFIDTVNNIISTSKLPHTLWQSLSWCRFLNLGTRVNFFTLWFDNEIRGWALFSTAFPTKGMSYSYLQRGPVGRSDKDIKEILNRICAYTGDYLLVDPSYRSKELNLNIKCKFVHYGQLPSDTLVLDLTKSNEDLLRAMKKKGRYNLNKSFKECFTVKCGTDSYLLDQFYSLVKKTTKRQNIPVLPKKDFNNKLATLDSKIFVIYKDKIPVSTAIVTIFNNCCYYHYGGMNPVYASTMSTYFLQWQLIQYGKERGCNLYDFIGISPINANTDHYLYNVSKFKHMFGGNRVTLADPFILINNRLKYRIIILMKYIKSFLKSFKI